MPSPALPPELEELRSRDIEPDVDSAADRALAMAAAIAQANQSQPANAAGTANHRGSIIIDQPQEKNIVEGREIQQVTVIVAVILFLTIFFCRATSSTHSPTE